MRDFESSAGKAGKASAALHKIGPNAPLSGFTMVELVVVIAIISLLAALLLPTLGNAKERGRWAACAQNERQLALALSMYAGENEDALPLPQQPSGRWPLQLQPDYTDLPLLVCPSDSAMVVPAQARLRNADSAPRSYLINAFADYYYSQSPAGNSTAATPVWTSTPANMSMKVSAIVHPSGTIFFGEKATGSTAYEANVFQPPSNSYLADLAENRHQNLARAANGGGSNAAMADGSVQYLPWGESTCPVNLWAVTDLWRTDAALCRPR